MTAPAIELVVLDGQGVVFSDPFAAFLDQLADVTGQDRAAIRARWRDDLRDRAWRGEIDDGELWRALVGHDGSTWGAQLEAAYRPGPAAPWLPIWAARVPVWLLSNHRTAWIEGRLERFGLRRFLSRVLVSDALGALKPEAAVFAPVLAQVGDPAAALVIDDQAKNVDAAAALGLSAVLADPAGRWIAEVERRLRLGVAPARSGR
jgi:HAD superfamily hydrolase (TIGR01509 family)